MKQGENTSYVQFSLLRSSAPVDLDAKVLVNYRDFHHTTQSPDWETHVDAVECGLRLLAFDGATPLYLRSGRVLERATRVVS